MYSIQSATQVNLFANDIVKNIDSEQNLDETVKVKINGFGKKKLAIDIDPNTTFVDFKILALIQIGANPTESVIMKKGKI